MIAFELEGVEIDRCVKCGGTWLDAGELAMITQLAGVEPGGVTHSLERAKLGRRGKKVCPRCGRRLRLVVVAPEGDGQSVELDRCPAGHGLWLDKGEMETAIALFEEATDAEESTVARFFADMFKHEL
jgi:Zn-finger nucleic acid-binding protein